MTFAQTNIYRIESLHDERLAPYRLLKEPQKLAQQGLFVAESRGVVETLLRQQHFKVHSVLAHRVALAALEESLASIEAETPIFIVEREITTQLIGFDMHRGCLALGERGFGRTLEAVLKCAGHDSLLVVLDEVSNPDNVGGIFRSALAFGACGLMLRQGCADPLYRKSIRTSMGAALRLPFCYAGLWPGDLVLLKEQGFFLVAMAPHGPAVDLKVFAAQKTRPKHLALLVGNEGQGLSRAALDCADVVVKIPMHRGVDSINVATAAAIAMHALID